MPCSIEGSTATRHQPPYQYPNIMRPSTGCDEKSSCQDDKIWQDIASQAQERTKQYEQPDSPIKACPLPEVIWSYYQEQGEAESTEERSGVEQIHTWFHEASLSIRFGLISWHRSRSSGSR